MLLFNRIAILASLVFAMSASAQTASPRASGSAKSQLDGTLFYELLLGELNARNGDSATAYSFMLDAARKTQSAELFQRTVEIALQARSGTSALQAAQAWKLALPDSKEANSFLFQILISLNRITDSLEPLKQELALTPAALRPAFIASIPQYYARASDKKLAVRTVEEALSESLRIPLEISAAWTSIGRMRFAAEQFDSAIEATRKAQEADQNAEDPVFFSLLMMRAKLPQAETLVLRNLDKRPKPEIRMEYARVLLGAQRFSEAQAQLQIITTTHANFPDAWLIQGVLQVEDNNLNAAEKSLTQYLSLVQPNQNTQPRPERGLTQAYLSLAQIAEQRKNYEEADAWLRRIDSEDNRLNAQLRRAVLLAKQGDVSSALLLIRSQTERSEADVRLKIAAEVQILRTDQQYAAAYKILRKATDQNPNDWDFVYDTAMIAEKMGNLPEMERLLRSVIAAKPDYHHAYNALGYSLADRSLNLTEAKQLILKALEFAKDDPFILDSLGWVEFRSGNQETALRILKSAFLAKPDTEIAAHLGEVMWMMGKRQEAIDVWKKGSLLNPKNVTLTETLKRLGVKW